MSECKGFRDLLLDCKKKVQENSDICKSCIFYELDLYENDEYCALYEIKIKNLKEDK